MQFLRSTRIRAALLVAVIAFIVFVINWFRTRGADTEVTVTPVSAEAPPPPDMKRLVAAVDIPAHVVINKTMVRAIEIKKEELPASYDENKQLPEAWLLRSVIKEQVKDAQGNAVMEGDTPKYNIREEDEVVNHVSKQNIPSGTKLERDMVGDDIKYAGIASLVPTGRVGMTVRVSREGTKMLQQMLKPGDYIDILATFKDDRFTKTIVRNARVLAVDVWADGRATPLIDSNIAVVGPQVPKLVTPPPDAQGKQGPPQPAPAPPIVVPTVSVAVTPEEAEVLMLADSYAELEFVVRGKLSAAAYEPPTGIPTAFLRGGKRLTDISPFLKSQPKPKTENGQSQNPTGRSVSNAAGSSLPSVMPAPVLATRSKPGRVPSPAPERAPAASKPGDSSAETRGIEVVSPRGVRVVEVPRDGN